MKVLDSMSHGFTQFIGRSNTVNTKITMEQITNLLKKYITAVNNRGVGVNWTSQKSEKQLKEQIKSSFSRLLVLENRAIKKSNTIKDNERIAKHNDIIKEVKFFKKELNLLTEYLTDTDTNTNTNTPPLKPLRSSLIDTSTNPPPLKPPRSSLNVSPKSAAEVFMANRKEEDVSPKSAAEVFMANRKEDFSTLAKGITTYAVPRPRPVKGLADSTRTNTPLSLAPGSSLNVAEPRNGAEIFMARKAGDDFTAFTQERAPKMVEDDSTVLDKEILKAKEHILSFKKDLAAKKEKLEGLGNSVQDFLEETKLKEGIDNINRKIDDLEFFITNFKSGNASPRSVALTSPSNSAPDDTSLVLKPQPFSEKLMGGQSESNLAPPQKEKPPVPPKPDYLKRGAVSQSPMSDKQVTNFSSKFEFKPVAALPDPVATSYALEKLKESTEV